MVGRSLWNIGVSLVTRALTRDKAALRDIGVLRPHVWKARTGLLDIDLNMHLNNSSYLYNMELARWHMTGLNGLLGIAARKKWMFLVASQSIRYRRSIAPYAPYEIHSQLVYWDDTWTYFSHQFVCPTTGNLYAEGLTRAILKRGKTTVAVPEIVQAMGLDVPAQLDEPEIVKGFVAWESAAKEKTSDWDPAAHVSTPKGTPFWKETINVPSLYTKKP
ncbi:hypothetical protein ACHHYP_13827 [Achlya hypogyna]|uniref:Thioesterase n=1 Tax=Achlya hypogyna TaxID=1202772 RepID=A0A1V9ZFE7_ACHHY|nr:hypothetical protein ACHHYP_13827 [Achlya hypogyna]